jgi:ribulose-phosphate 3-epimerase
MDIIPAILTNDPRELEDRLRRYEEREIERVHIDIIDGEFAPGKTVPLDSLENFETSVLLDIHLMVNDPVSWVEHAARSLAERIIGQVEQMGNQEEFVGRVTAAGARVGLGMDIETPVSVLEDNALMDADVILVMGRKAGWEEQSFDEAALEKVRQLSELREAHGAHFKILVDGGVNAQNIDSLEQAGADEVAVGHAFEELC